MKLILENETSIRRTILGNLLSELNFNSIRDFQKHFGLLMDGKCGRITYNALYKTILNVEEVDFFEGSYWRQTYPKNQIVWHHSAGWDSNRRMFESWKFDRRWHVATAVGIQDDGSIMRGYDEQYFAVHIGAYDMRLPNYYKLERQSIGVEVCNWGWLTYRFGKYFSWTNVEIPEEKVIELNYKQQKYFEKYTDQEMETLKYWTILNAMRFDIPLDYRADDMWEYSKNAVQMVPGIYSHNSYDNRGWKTDVSPQPHLIEMAKGLIEYTR